MPMGNAYYNAGRGLTTEEGITLYGLTMSS